MPTAVRAYRAVVPAYTEAPRISLAFRLLRDGEVTSGPKTVWLYRGTNSLVQMDAAFTAELGEFTPAQSFSLATLLAQGEWLVLGEDNTLPRRVRTQYLTLDAAGTYTVNITSGEGGQQGEPAALAGLVRVDRQPANREIVLLERPADGEWRLAGFGETPGGSGQIEARVVGGQLFALSVDDYGVEFAPGLSVAVGQRVRPSLFYGVLYQITEAGVLPAAEPAWWPISTLGSRQLGTARAEAVRYFRPLAHGPVTAELI